MIMDTIDSLGLAQDQTSQVEDLILNACYSFNDDDGLRTFITEIFILLYITAHNPITA